MTRLLGIVVAIVGICYALGAVLLGWLIKLAMGFVGWCKAMDEKL